MRKNITLWLLWLLFIIHCYKTDMVSLIIIFHLFPGCARRPGVLKDLKTMGSVSLFIFFVTLLVLARQVSFLLRRATGWFNSFLPAFSFHLFFVLVHIIYCTSKQDFSLVGNRCGNIFKCCRWFSVPTFFSLFWGGQRSIFMAGKHFTVTPTWISYSSWSLSWCFLMHATWLRIFLKSICVALL